MSAPLSDAHGYELVRVATKWKLPVDLQKLIWADVTGRYHRRHGRWGSFGLPVIEKAHVVIQTAARRMLAIIEARWNGPRWIFHEFVGRRLDYAQSIRLPKDMRQFGYDPQLARLGGGLHARHDSSVRGGGQVVLHATRSDGRREGERQLRNMARRRLVHDRVGRACFSPNFCPRNLGAEFKLVLQPSRRPIGF